MGQQNADFGCIHHAQSMVTMRSRHRGEGAGGDNATTWIILHWSVPTFRIRTQPPPVPAPDRSCGACVCGFEMRFAIPRLKWHKWRMHTCMEALRVRTVTHRYVLFCGVRMVPCHVRAVVAHPCCPSVRWGAAQPCHSGCQCRRCRWLKLLCLASCHIVHAPHQQWWP